MTVVKVGDICNLVNGKAFKPSDWSPSGVPIIRIQNLNGAEKPFNHWAGSLDGQVRIQSGDVLLAWSGTPGTSFGVHIWERMPAILNQHIFRVDLDKKRIGRRWFMYAVNGRLNRLIAQAHGGVGLQHVTRRMVDELEIPLPPLDEQRRIAAILDKADALDRKSKRAVELLDSLSQSIFLEMFPANSGEVCLLGDICELIRDGVHKTPNYTETGVPFVTVKNIVTGTLDLSQTKFVSQDEHHSMTKRVRPEAGDILVSKDGTIGVPCVVPEGTVFSIFVSVALLKLKREVVLPEFLAEQIRTENVQKQIRDSSKGIAIRHLHLGDFAKLKIVVPSMTRQLQFNSLVLSLKEKKRVLMESVGALDSLSSSLQHCAFSGQL